MKIMKTLTHLLTLSLIISCQVVLAQQPSENMLQNMFVGAEPGDTIYIPAGEYNLNRSLWLDEGKDVLILGDGMDETVLSFSNQKDGAEGIKVTNSNNIRIESLTVQDSKGDAIKVQETDGIAFINVKAEWTGKPDEKNGAYGLYPVMCSNVLIDQCEAVGASDAGIYVGQSKDIIVKNSVAHHNVAGIEIENSLNADVFDNLAYENTGGLLVFDLPGLVQKKGGNVRLFNNEVRDNNYKNFAPKGNIVGKVPPGTGVMILATNNVEIYGNKITNNKTAGTAIISYYMTEEPISDTTYYPYPTAINIHDNEYSRERIRATFKGRMGKLFRLKLKFGKDVPHIIYDGIIDSKLLTESGNMPDDSKICIRNNKNQTFANIDAENDFKNISDDLSNHDCTQSPLSSASLKNFGDE